MGVFQQPPTIGLLLGPKQLNRFVHARIWRVPERAEVIESAQHVVLPADWKRELEPGWVDDFAAALASKQLSLEEVLLTAFASGNRFGSATGRALTRQQSFQYVDRRIKRRAYGT